MYQTSDSGKRHFGKKTCLFHVGHGPKFYTIFLLDFFLCRDLQVACYLLKKKADPKKPDRDLDDMFSF